MSGASAGRWKLRQTRKQEERQREGVVMMGFYGCFRLALAKRWFPRSRVGTSEEQSAQRRSLPPHRPKAQPKAGQIDPLARFLLIEVAAVQTDAQVDPQTGDLVGVVVAVLVGVGFEKPAIESAFLARAGGFFLPAFQEAPHVR